MRPKLLWWKQTYSYLSDLKINYLNRHLHLSHHPNRNLLLLFLPRLSLPRLRSPPLSLPTTETLIDKNPTKLMHAMETEENCDD